MSSSSSEGDGFEMRGVKLSLLQSIANLAKSKGGDWSVGRISNVLIGAHEIMKAGHRWGADVDPYETLTFADQRSFIDVLQIHYKDANNLHPVLGCCYDEVVGEKATKFCSFAYACDFMELVGSLESLVAMHPEYADDYFWFDPLVNNQWQAADHDFQWWATTFKTAIASIGSAVLICLPWSDPDPLKRAWCLWEVYCAIESGAKFDVALGEGQRDAFLTSLTMNFGKAFIDMLNAIDVEKSKCWLPSDQENIFTAVRSTIGFKQLNTIVVGRMREWALNEIKKSKELGVKLLDFKNEDGTTRDPLKGEKDFLSLKLWSIQLVEGILNCKTGVSYDIDALKKCLEDYKYLYSTGDSADAKILYDKTLNELYQYYNQTRRFDEAIETYDLIKRLRLSTGVPSDDPNEEHKKQVIDVKQASFWHTRGEYQKAIDCYIRFQDYLDRSLSRPIDERAKRNFLLTLVDNKLGMADSYRKWGEYIKSSHDDKSKYMRALSLLEESEKIILSLYGPDNHTSLIYTYMGMGQVYGDLEHHNKAIEYSIKALDIITIKYGEDCKDRGNIFSSIGVSYRKMGLYNQALEFQYKALNIDLRSEQTASVPRTGSTYNNIALVYSNLKDFPKAIENFEKSIEVLTITLPQNHPTVLMTYKSLGFAYLDAHEQENNKEPIVSLTPDQMVHKVKVLEHFALRAFECFQVFNPNGSDAQDARAHAMFYTYLIWARNMQQNGRLPIPSPGHTDRGRVLQAIREINFSSIINKYVESTPTAAPTPIVTTIAPTPTATTISPIPTATTADDDDADGGDSEGVVPTKEGDDDEFEVVQEDELTPSGIEVLQWLRSGIEEKKQDATAAATTATATATEGVGLTKDVTEMSVKELKQAIVQTGLESQSVGFCEKSEFVALLLEHRAGSIVVGATTTDAHTDTDTATATTTAVSEREPVRSALLATSGDASLATENLLDSMYGTIKVKIKVCRS